MKTRGKALHFHPKLRASLVFAGDNCGNRSLLYELRVRVGLRSINSATVRKTTVISGIITSRLVVRNVDVFVA